MTRAVLGIVMCSIVLASSACSSEAGRDPASSSPPGPVTTTTTPPWAVEGGRFEVLELEVGAGTPKLPATLRIPPDPSAGAVLLSSAGPADQDGRYLARTPVADLAEGLASRGVATLTYDNRFFVQLDELSARGDVGVRELVLGDLADAFQVLVGQTTLDERSAFLVGFSTGGWIAPLTAEEVDPAGLVIVSAPAGRLEDHLLHIARTETRADDEVTDEEQAFLDLAVRQTERIRNGEFDANTPPGDLLGMPGRFWSDVSGYTPVDTLLEMEIPTLVVVGERDWELTKSDRIAWRRAAENSRMVEFEELEDLDHHLSESTVSGSRSDYAAAAEMDPVALDVISRWVLAHAE